MGRKEELEGQDGRCMTSGKKGGNEKESAAWIEKKWGP